MEPSSYVSTDIDNIISINTIVSRYGESLAVSSYALHIIIPESLSSPRKGRHILGKQRPTCGEINAYRGIPCTSGEPPVIELNLRTNVTMRLETSIMTDRYRIWIGRSLDKPNGASKSRVETRH
jgi:hypothetical protein